MMRVEWSPDLEMPDRPRVAALGAFDGLHLGHARTIQKMRSIARERAAEATVLTFDPSPREFEEGVRQPGQRLTPLDEQMYHLRRLGVDLAVVFDYPGRIHAVEPEDFVRRVLVGQLGVVHLTAGGTHHFGRGGRGDLALLQELGVELGFGVEVVEPLTIGGERVSSTRIRHLLSEGQVRRAGALLGRPYAIYASVVSGRGLGSEIGYPTANLRIPSEKTLPRDGVYAGLCTAVRGGDCEALEQPRAAAINVGLAPTVQRATRVVEVHIVGEDCDLQGACVRTQFLRWLRAERRFDDLDALREQIARDARQALREAASRPRAEMRRFDQFCVSEDAGRRGGCPGGEPR